MEYQRETLFVKSTADLDEMVNTNRIHGKKYSDQRVASVVSGPLTVGGYMIIFEREIEND